MFKAQLVRQDPENPADLLISDVSNIDMKGSFPPRLMNMALSNMMSKGLKDLSDNLKKIEKEKV